MSIATPEQRKVIYQAYRRVYKRLWAKRYYAEKHSVEKTQSTVIHKEDRRSSEVEYCQCGCGKVLTRNSYTEHYQTRECFVHCFHLNYHSEKAEK